MIRLEEVLSAEQLAVWTGLTSPEAIQAYLDETPYPATDLNRCPAAVMQDRWAHCLDGGLFGAAALRRLGYPPLLVDLLPEPGLDDDHILAVYRVGGAWGAVAKSNFTGLRARQPVYRSLRELAMSYFEAFFNVDGVRTLRAYTRALDLRRLDRFDWETSEAGANAVEQRLLHLRPIALLDAEQGDRLPPVDRISYQAGTLGTNVAGLYKPGSGGHSGA